MENIWAILEVKHWKDTLDFFQIVTCKYVCVFVYVYVCVCVYVYMYMNIGLAEGKWTYA
jgi:hypothetical protein